MIEKFPLEKANEAYGEWLRVETPTLLILELLQILTNGAHAHSLQTPCSGATFVSEQSSASTEGG